MGAAAIHHCFEEWPSMTVGFTSEHRQFEGTGDEQLAIGRSSCNHRYMLVGEANRHRP
jgi:hypothetical protein